VKYITFLFVAIFMLSCQKNQEQQKVKKPKPLMRVIHAHTATENVLPMYLKEVKDWKELQAIDSFFVKFRKITPNEALSNAVELKDLIKQLNDSVKPANFKAPSLTARINILFNEALRLADLTEIGAIKAQEVNTQVDKTMAAFSNVNTKVNTIMAKIKFENEIDIDVSFIGLDTTRIEQVPKKSIILNPKKKPVKKKRIYKGIKMRKQ